MSVVDSKIQLPGGAQSGANLDVSEVTTGAGVVERERHNVADPEEAAAIAKVRNESPLPTDYGLVVRVAEQEPDWNTGPEFGAVSFAGGGW